MVIENPTGEALTGTRIVDFPDMGRARAPWVQLAGATANIFSTWEWAEVWWRHFGDGATPRLVGVERNGEIAAILPMQEQRRRGVRVLRFVGHGAADQLGPVCAPEDIGIASEALGEMLAGGAVLLAERLPADRDWARQLDGTLLAHEPSPIIDLAAEGDFNSYLQARSSNFRQQIRRRARRLSGEGVTFELTEDPTLLQRDLGSLFALHEARWGDQSGAFSGRREGFHREFAALALERGWLRLWIASAGTKPVAAWYGFRFAGVDSFYQSGRDPEWDRLRVGAGLLEHTIRDAFDAGMREYRLLRGDEEYKRRYASREASICTVAAARRALARGTVAVVSLLLRVRGGRRLLGSADG